MSAEEFFTRWYAWGMRFLLRPVIKAAKMLNRHLPSLVNYFRHQITNATSEGFNSVIQALKYAARGFRSFHDYSTRIRFFCGKLDLRPRLSCH
jgi:transposase